MSEALHCRAVPRILLSLLLATLVTTAPAAVPRHEFRALWVDTFNTTLNRHADVLRVVEAARAANLNVILAQVRRRGDAWYLDAREPAPDFVPIEPGFDALGDLVSTAHAFGIQLHAFVIIGAIWNKDPALAAPANGPPLAARHVFNRHGGYDAARRAIVTGPENWLTRTLIADGSATSYQGHRIGSDFWLDFGHPEAAAYTVDVLTHLVRQYDVDGLHLDRIRYPELTAAGQTPATGASIGYNAISVARFNRRYGLADSTVPSPGDARWADWRRTQITNLVRRIYLNVVAIKPDVIVSAALIAFGGGPTTETGWLSAEAHWRVYQDWRAWLEEGIVDVGIPMNYKREHDPAQARQFDEWSAWLRAHQYRRAGLIGLGAFLNGAEGTLRQVRRSLNADGGSPAAGVAFFSLANATEAVTANPWSLPARQNTPKRGFEELAAGLTTGESVDRRTRYESPSEPIFQDAAFSPLLPWKRASITGHVMGVAAYDDGTVLDGVGIRLTDLRTGIARTVDADGGGFFGFVDVDPGRHAGTFAKSGTVLQPVVLDVIAGRVTAVDLRPRAATSVPR